VSASIRRLRNTALVLVAVLVLAACGNGDGDAGEVSFLHTISGEGEQAALQEAIDAFEASSGHSVSAEFTTDFNTTIATRIQGGNPPDVALYPQPGLLEQMVQRDGPITFADAGIEIDGLVPGMLETGTFDGDTYGVVVKLGVKSLVWYPKAAFDAAGYAVPQTWDEMMDLAEEIAATGTPAWCIGIESGGDTGWPATDWIEDIMLRLHGPDVYDQWVTNEIPFDSPEVREAFEVAAEIWFNDDYVLGGPTGIVNTGFLSSPEPMFQDPPGCYLHKQAGFIAGEFPGEIGTEYDVFFLPPIDPSIGNGALFGGDLAAVHTDKAAAAEFVEFLASREGQEAWLGHPGAGGLSARADFDASVYPNPGLEAQGALFAGADFARFDASDLMPGQVGAGAFWTDIVRWLGGAQDLDETLANIDAAW
jgi:alpha-glucoside transport system substrate-binding protein